MHEKTIEIPTADGRMETFITHPEEGGPFAPVVVYMGVWGLREELYLRLTDRTGPVSISTTPGLFFSVSWALPGVYGAVRSRRAEKFLCDARDGCRKIGIVRSALDDGLLFDQGLILPM